VWSIAKIKERHVIALKDQDPEHALSPEVAETIPIVLGQTIIAQ
jgi:hypothetical protein